MESKLLSPTDGSWMTFLESVEHDTYHLPGYVSVDAQRLGGEPLAILIENGDRALFLPLILRPLPGGIEGSDAVSPYGYPGPLLSAEAQEDDSFVKASGAAVRDLLSDMQCCAAFIRCHPLLKNAERLFEGIGTLRWLGPTVWIDLHLDEEERWTQMTRNSRRSINRTRFEGYDVVVDEGWDLLDDFLSLYWETMERVGASDSYYFDRQYFVELKAALGEQAHMLAVLRHGDVVAAGLYLERCGIVQFHLSGSKRLEGKLSADRLMIDHASAWFAERGNGVLHLGGGVGAASDTLLRFKAGFSPLRGSYSVWEVVTNREMFRLACATAPTPDTEDGVIGSRYFPPYRRA